MGLFSRKEKVIDLAKDYNDEIKFNKAKGKALQSSQITSTTPTSDFAFLGNLASSSTSSGSSYGSDDYGDSSLSSEEKKKKLAKRLVDMTEKIEDLSNQIYHLQQRIEVLEKKLNRED